MSARHDRAAPRDRHTLDRLAIWLSGLCLVHCLVFPIAIAILPVLAGILPRQWWVHPVILAAALPLAVVALVRGWRRSGDVRPLLIGATGLAFLIAGVVAAEGSTAEVVLTVTGGLVLSSAHVLNWRLGTTRRTPRCECCAPA